MLMNLLALVTQRQKRRSRSYLNNDDCHCRVNDALPFNPKLSKLRACEVLFNNKLPKSNHKMYQSITVYTPTSYLYTTYIRASNLIYPLVCFPNPP